MSLRQTHVCQAETITLLSGVLLRVCYLSTGSCTFVPSLQGQNEFALFVAPLPVFDLICGTLLQLKVLLYGSATSHMMPRYAGMCLYFQRCN